jgi:hypothetical protein
MPGHSKYSRDVLEGATVVITTCSALCGNERSTFWAFALTAWLLSPFMQNVYKEKEYLVYLKSLFSTFWKYLKH